MYGHISRLMWNTFLRTLIRVTQQCVSSDYESVYLNEVPQMQVATSGPKG